ncbi:MAG: 23S rRNA (guanosine(2251)-2'-O)-methyltransferase RlmB [Erysipelotrichaceae bacterium]
MLNYIYGKNSVKQALGIKNINRVLVTNNTLNEFKFLFKKNHLKFEVVEKDQLTKTVGSDKHQGIALEISEYQTYDIDEIINTKEKNGLIVMLDGLEDPHNLGAILRTADAVGVEGVIYGKNRNVSLNATVAKVSTGAINTVKVVEVTNLNQTIRYLKDQGYWIIGVELGGQDYKTIDYNMPICLIIGSEGKGISRLVKENCDYLVSLPMRGLVNSLNASVATGVMLYEITGIQKK